MLREVARAEARKVARAEEAREVMRVEEARGVGCESEGQFQGRVAKKEVYTLGVPLGDCETHFMLVNVSKDDYDAFWIERRRLEKQKKETNK